MKKNLNDKIHDELSMVRTQSKTALLILSEHQEGKELQEDILIATLEDLENRYWKICEHLEPIREFIEAVT